MSKIAGELNAEMSKTIGSKEYNEWLNRQLTKALKRSFEQSITDPENQPSQYGTVTLAMYEHLEEQITASQQRVAELEKERDRLSELCDKWHFECDDMREANNHLANVADALMQQRDELLAALECRWRPIETAPKNKEVFIGAFIDGEFHFGKSVRYYERGNEFEGEFYHGWYWSIDDVSESVADNPTHWMPLPPAPAIASVKEKS